MKRLMKGITILSILAGVFAVCHATGLTTNTSDVIDYCTGPNNSNCVYRIDSAGNEYLLGVLTTSGSGTSTINGAISVAGTSTFAGKTAYTPTVVTGISTTTTISPSATYLILVSSGSSVLAGTTIVQVATATAVNGQYLILGSTSPFTVTLTSGTAEGLDLGSATRVIGAGKRLGLIYDSLTSMWTELFYGNN